MASQRYNVLILAFVMLGVLGFGVTFAAALAGQSMAMMTVGAVLLVVAGPGAVLTFKLKKDRTWASRAGRPAESETFSIPPDAVDLSVRLRDTVMRGAPFAERCDVRLDGRGVTLSKGGANAGIPHSAVRAAGLIGPVHDPTITVWYDPGGVSGDVAELVGERRGPDGTTAALLAREESLPEGRRAAVRQLTRTRWSVPWTVADEEGTPVPAPDPRALLTADRLLIGEAGYHLEAGSPCLAAICEEEGQRQVAGVRQNVPQPQQDQNPLRTVRLRDPWAEPILTVHKPRSMFYNRQQVTLGDGTPVGEVKETGTLRRKFELFDTAGRTVARTEQSRADARPGEVCHVLLDEHGARFAVLTLANENPFSEMRLTIETAPPEQLRTLTVALPIAMRVAMG